MATENTNKEKTVKIRLPKTKDLTDDVRVWINTRSWTIKRGVEVEVPECVAECLRHKEEMEEYAMNFSASMQAD
jgi:hypothetical protein